MTGHWVLLFLVIHTAVAYHGCEVNVTYANCTNRNLTEIPETLPGNIIVLDLSDNRITEIRDNAFVNQNNLEMLYLRKNYINIIQDDAFIGLESLKILSLAENNLKPMIYSEKIFSYLQNLEELYLQRNLHSPDFRIPLCSESICKYPDTSFSLLQNLKVLSMDLCAKSDFGIGFLNLTILQKLTFDFCLACTLSNETFYNFRNSNITDLSLSRCWQYKAESTIDTRILQPFPNLKWLDLSFSYFTLKNALNLLRPFQNKSMELINLHRVSIGIYGIDKNSFKITVTKDMMKYLKTICVKTLILSYNGIVDANPNSLFVYDHPECFENVILSANSMSFQFSEQLMEIIQFSVAVKNLKLFDYSYVPGNFLNKRFILPPKLEIPTVENSGRSSIEREPAALNFTFFLPQNLESLRLSHVMTQVLLYTIVLKNTGQLKFVDLSYFQIATFPNIFLTEEPEIEYLDISGIDSNLYAGKNFIKHFRKVETIVIRDANLDTSLQFGKNVFVYLRNYTKDLDVSRNHLANLPLTFRLVSNLARMNMSRNSFRHFPKALVLIESLSVIDISYNKLFTLDDETRTWLDFLAEKRQLFLFLKENEFSCTCSNRFFIKWIFTTKVILDGNRNYSCYLDDQSRTSTTWVYSRYHDLYSHCDAIVWMRVGVICIMSSFLLIGSSAIVYQFRWRMAYFCYRKLKAKYLNNYQKEDFKYDVFIAYAFDSEKWLITTLVPKLEKEWGLCVCVKDRDFPAGADRTDTVISGIRNSKSVIFIITPAFSKRQWGRFEIEMAKYEMFAKQRRQKKIIVIMKNGTKIEEVPFEFSLIWKDVTLINWPDENISTENVWYDLKLQIS
ncbi:toll-like receptor 1 [Mytilus galloprovincialis]|uniref:toll-like receptor 1 n=1 Tax=Mytilus galloprovincialis TaxID=29158 RepID=UPI003F7C4F5D